MQWVRVLGRMAAGKADRSPLVADHVGHRRSTSGSTTKTVYELDGGDRPKTKRLKIRVEPARHPGLRARRPGTAVSTATLVPETWELTGDDARQTLRHTGRRRLLADAFQRLRVADGFSHARSLAFMIVARPRAGPHRRWSGWPARSATPA